MCDVIKIPASNGLDEITVFWEDFGVAQGQVTIICWGSVWTQYFGGMGGQTIREFFSQAGTSYLVDKMVNKPWLKQSKRHEEYLAKLINAVKAYLAAPPSENEVAHPKAGE